MFSKFVNYLASRPAIFSCLRKLAELNFAKQKKLIKNNLEIIPGKKILDIGCGTGEFAGLFKNLDYTGIDIDPAYIDYAKKHYPGSFQIMDATQLDFPDETFDRLLIMATLHHLDNEQMAQVLAEAKRVLKNDGRAIIMEHAHIAALEDWSARFFQKFDKGDFIREPADYQEAIQKYFKILKQENFKNCALTYCSFILEK
jgi:ubiquinone/menaquinone biosynthesis C-methylase UbiE